MIPLYVVHKRLPNFIVDLGNTNSSGYTLTDSNIKNCGLSHTPLGNTPMRKFINLTQWAYGIRSHLLRDQYLINNH